MPTPVNSKLLFWYSAGHGITRDGSSISEWKDYAGRYPMAATNALYSAGAAPNGKPAVDISTLDGNVDGTGGATFSTRHLVWLVKINDWVLNRAILGFAGMGAAVIQNSAEPNEFFFVYPTLGTIQDIPLGQWFIVSASVKIPDSEELQVKIHDLNGYTLQTGVSGSGVVLTPNSAFARGVEVAEIMGYNARLSSGELDDVIAWFQSKYKVTPPSLYLYLQSQVVINADRETAFNRWQEPNDFGINLSPSPAAAREDAGVIEFLNTETLEPGRYELLVDAGNEGQIDSAFTGFDINLDIGAGQYQAAVKLVEGVSGSRPRDTTKIEFELQSSVSNWSLSFDWTNDRDVPERGQSRALAIYGYTIRLVKPVPYRVTLDPLAIEETSTVSPSHDAPGGWIGRLNSFGTVASWQHESKAVPSLRQFDGPSGFSSPTTISGIATGSTARKRDDLLIKSYTGTLKQADTAWSTPPAVTGTSDGQLPVTLQSIEFVTGSSPLFWIDANSGGGTDQTGNGHNFTLTAIGSPYKYFSDSAFKTASAAIIDDPFGAVTMFMVAKHDFPDSGAYTILSINPSDQLNDSSFRILLQVDEKYVPSTKNPTAGVSGGFLNSPENTWRTIAAVWEKYSDTVSFYVNCNPVAAATESPRRYVSPGNIGFGSLRGVGLVNHMMAFNTALSIAQIRSLHNLVASQYGITEV
jgi:hypothetical protein